MTHTTNERTLVNYPFQHHQRLNTRKLFVEGRYNKNFHFFIHIERKTCLKSWSEHDLTSHSGYIVILDKNITHKILYFYFGLSRLINSQLTKLQRSSRHGLVTIQRCHNSFTKVLSLILRCHTISLSLLSLFTLFIYWLF